MKNELKKICMQILLCIFMCIIISISVSIMLHLNMFISVSTYIYRLYIMLFLTMVILIIVAFIICIKTNKIFNFTFSTSVLCIGISSLFMALFFSLGPMVIERSYTVYSLAYLTDYNNVYSYDEIRDQFVIGYVDNGATQKRIDEQVSIGNIEKIGENYRITDKGERLIKLFRLIEKIFPVTDQSSIYPKKLK